MYVDKKTRILLFILSGVVLISDQASKLWATEVLKEGKILKPLGSDLLWFVLVHNSGLAFGLKLMPSLLLTIMVMIAALGLALYLVFKRDLLLRYALPLTLVMAGAFGNLIDRLRYGYVVDFISVDLPDFIMDRWPVFNIADSAVSVGVIILLFLNLFPQKNLSPEPSLSTPTGEGITETLTPPAHYPSPPGSAQDPLS